MKNTVLDFCVFCHNFQRRSIWQLSSILQQNCDVDQISIRISSLKNNGNPKTEDVVDFFKNKGLNIYHKIFENREIFAKRGLVRNFDVIESKSDWIFFADIDNVYHPDFFGQLFYYLQNGGKNVSNCIASIEKFHTNIDSTNKIMENTELEVIENCYERSLKIPTIIKRNKRTAAGCMQVVNKNKIPGGIYVNRTLDYHLFLQGQHAASDKRFRKVMGGSTLINLPVQIHLNHKRDKEVGYHIEDQR